MVRGLIPNYINMKKEIKIGDTIYVEQAWEDEAGHYHDEYAVVKAIDEDGNMTLEFSRKDITDWLECCEFNVKDYKPE